MKSLIITSFIALTILMMSCSKTKTMVNTQTVKELELDKFLGKWYEIARYPHSFEKDLVGVTATYSMRDDGKIRVVNQGFKQSLDGKRSSAEGKAKVPNPSEPGKLKVSFFWFFYADYFVMELDSNNYEWAVIGSSSSKYLWVLSRSPQMDDKLYQDLMQKIQNRGYNLDKLQKVEHAEVS